MLRVVVDVNVLVSALLSPAGAPAAVLSAWRGALFELVASPLLISELTDVLLRPQHAERTGIAGPELLEFMRANAVIAEDPPTERFVPGDPGDDYLVALARAARAQVIVTGDAHLLEADLLPPAIPPREFLERLERLPS